MHLWKAERDRTLFTMFKDSKTVLITLLLACIVLAFSLNRVSSIFSLSTEIALTIVAVLFLLRVILGAFSLPLMTLTEDIRSDRLMPLFSTSAYSFEAILSVRLTYRALYNILLNLVFFVLVIGTTNNLELAPLEYVLLFVICVIGIYSILGIGLVLASLGLLLKIKAPVMMMGQLLLFYGIMSASGENLLVPFATAKLFIYNVLTGNEPTGDIIFSSIWKSAVNSLVFYVFGLYVFKAVKFRILKTDGFTRDR